MKKDKQLSAALQHCTTNRLYMVMSWSHRLKLLE